jgi:uncharacterized protein YcfJ
MAVDLIKYRAENAGFYGQSSLADVAADLHERSGSAKAGVAFEDFARQNGFDAQIAQETQPKPQPQQQPGYGLPGGSVTAGDYARSIGVGLDQFGQVLGRGMQWVGLDRAGKAVEGLYKERETATRGQQFGAYKAEMAKPFVQERPDGGGMFGYGLGPGVTSPAKILGTIVESVPAMAAAGGPAVAATRGLIGLGLNAGVAGIVGSGLGEGVIGGLYAAKEGEDQILEAPDGVLQQHPDYQQALAALPADMPEAERQASAKASVARGEALRSGLIAGGATAVLGAPSGHFLGKSIGGETGRTLARTIGKQAVLEAGQEASQSAVEQLVRNDAARRYINPDQSMGEGVAEAMVGGAITGGVMGGGLGGFSHNRAALQYRQDFQAETAKAITDGSVAGLADDDLGRAFQIADGLYRENPDEGLQQVLLGLNAEQFRRQGAARGFPLNEFLADDDAARAAAAQQAAQPQEAPGLPPEAAAGPAGPDRGAELTALSKRELNDLAAGLGIAKPGRIKRDELVASVLQAEDAARRWNDPEAVAARYQEAHAAPFPGQVDGFLEGVAPVALSQQAPAAAPESGQAAPDRAAELSGLAYSELRDMAASLGVEKPGRLKRAALVPAIVAAEEQARHFYDPANLDARYQETHAAPFPGGLDGFLDGVAPVGQPQPAEGRASRKRQPKAAAEQEPAQAGQAAAPESLAPSMAQAAGPTGEIPLVEIGATPEAVQEAEPEAQSEARPALVEQTPAGVLPTGEIPLTAVGETPAAGEKVVADLPQNKGQEPGRDVAGYPAVETGQPQADMQEAQAPPAAEDLKARSKRELNDLAVSLGIERPVEIRRDDLVGRIGQARQEAAAGSVQEQPGAAGAPQTAKVWSGDTLREVPVVEHDGVKTVNVMGQGMPPRYAVLNALAGSDEHQISQYSGNTPAEAVAAAKRPPEPPHPMNAATRGRALQAMAPDQQNALGKVLGIKPGRKSRLGFLEAISDTPELKLRAAYDTVVGEAGQQAEADKSPGVATGEAQGDAQDQAAVPPGDVGAVAEPAAEVPAQSEPSSADAAPKEEARDEPAAEAEQNESAAVESRPEEAAGAATPEQSEKIGLALGEKIGGSRKDTAAPTGPRVRLPGKDDSVPAWKKRFMAVQVSETGFRSGEDKIYWSIADQKGLLRTGRFKFDSKEEAEAAIPLAAVSLKHRVTKRGEAWEIYRKVTDRKTVVIKDGFATEEDAKRYMAEHAEDILNTKTGFGEEILVRPEKVFRKGAPRREGPAKGQDFLDAFGFRGVEFGEWNDQDERQEVLNHAYDGLLDLAELLNVPPKALSLNGDLALAFGSRGRGLSSAKAHYERDYGVINLTKLTGAGSLAHEWYHALDHYLGRQDTKASSEKVENKRGDRVFAASDAPSRDYLSHGASRKSQVREALRAAYEKLLGDIAYKAEQYKEDTEKAEQFVSRARGYLERNLKDIRTGLAQDAQWGRKRAPAKAGQLERFDALAEQLLSGDNLALEMRSNEAGGRQRSRFGSYRSSNDILDGLAAIYKEVRGRSGFNAERTGPFNSLAANVQDFARRAKMLEDARSKTEKTKQIPTEYRRAAYLMDQGRTSDYWSEPHEMAARAFSSYVEDRVAQDDGRSDFLVYGANNAMLEYRLVNVRPFPEGAEREAINAAFDTFFQTVKTKETGRGVAMFQREDGSEAPASPITRAVAAELRQGISQFPALRGIVDVYQSEADMPADLREAVEDAGVSGRFHGVYDAETKRIALVAGNIPTVKAGQTAFVQMLLRHEGRHAGLDRVLGGVREREDYMARAAQAIPREVTRWLTRHGMESNRRNRAEAAEEILVSWAKDGTVHRALDRLLSKIAAWVRSIFPTLELTRAELRQLLAQADDFVDGKGLDFIAPPGQPFSAAPAFSRGEGASWAQQVDDFLGNRFRPHERLDLGGTPPVIGLLGGHDLPLQMTQGKANKILKGADAGGKHGVSPEVLKQLPQALERPVVVLKSATWADSLVLVTELPHQGSFLVAAVHLNVREGRAEINEVASVHARGTQPQWVSNQIRDGGLLYRDKTKVPGWQRSFGLQLPTEMPTRDKRKIFTEVDLVKYEQGLPQKGSGPRFARTGDLAGVPDEKRDVATWLKDEASANVRSILAGVHGLSETGVLGKMVRSPEYWQQPVLKRLYETFRDRTDRAHELLHQAFDVGDGRTIIQEAKDVLKDPKQREILNAGVDHADVNEVGPEAMETWFAEHGANEATIGLWRIMRERYDMLLDERLASYRKLIDKARSGYERKIVRRLIDAGIPADAAKAFDAAGYNSDKTLADELAPYADEVKAVVAAARKAGVTIKGQLSDVKLHDENGTSFSFAEMVEKMGQLRGFYAPRLREQGDYVVRGQRTGADGDIERFRAHKEWRKSAEKLRLEMRRAGWDMEPVGKLDKLPEATQGILKTLELAKTVESAVNQVGEDVDAGLVQEILETLADEVKARGFRSQSIRRSGRHGEVVQGYFKDAVERFARYAGSTAYGLAKMEAAEKAAKVLFGTAGAPGLDIKKERDTYRLAVDYLAENLRNAESGDRVFALAKSVASLKYLGLNPKSALVNLSSMATSVPAALHAYAMQGKGGWSRVGREIARSMYDYLGRMTKKWGRFTADEQRFLDEIRRESLDDPQFAREALSVYRDTAGQGWSWLMGKSMALFGATEQLNRGATLLAGYRLARAGGADHATAVARARETSDRAHGVYDRATQPAWTWGTSIGARVGQAWYVYKKYGHNYLQLVHELFAKKDWQAATFALAAPAVLGGLGGHVLTSLAKALMAAGGGDDDPEKWLYDFLGKNLGGEAEDLARFGLLGLATGADLSGSLGTMIDMPDTWSDVLGPMGGLGKDMLTAVGYLAGGQPGRAAEKVLPSGVAKVLQAVRESDQGVTTGKNYPVLGEDGKPLKPSRGESVAKGLGFRPLREARARDRTSEAITEEKRFGDRRDVIYARFRAFALDGGQDADERQDLVAAVAEYNQDVAEAGLTGRVSPITKESLLRQTERLARPTKREQARLSGPAGRAETAPAVAPLDAGDIEDLSHPYYQVRRTYLDAKGRYDALRDAGDMEGAMTVRSETRLPRLRALVGRVQSIHEDMAGLRKLRLDDAAKAERMELLRDRERREMDRAVRVWGVLAANGE